MLYLVSEIFHIIYLLSKQCPHTARTPLLGPMGRVDRRITEDEGKAQHGRGSAARVGVSTAVLSSHGTLLGLPF